MAASSSPSSPAGDAAAAERLQRLAGYLQVDPDNPHLLRDYARQAFAASEYRAAATAVERLRTLGVAVLDDELACALAWRLEGEGDRALQVLDAAAERWPDDGRLAVERAKVYFGRRAFDAALEALPAAAADPAAADEARALRVRLLHHLERLDDALAVAMDSGELPGPVARAVLPVLMDTDHLDEAAALARGLAEANPPGAPAPYEACEPLAAAALDRDDAAEAQQWSAQALVQRQDDGRVWLLHGLAQLRAGDREPAIASLGRAATLMPEHAGSLLALGWALLADQQLPQAEAAFQEARDVSPAFSESHGSLGVLAAMRGEHGKARELIRTARRLDPESAAAAWAEKLLEGHTHPEQVARLAALVTAQARRSRRAAPTRNND